MILNSFVLVAITGSRKPSDIDWVLLTPQINVYYGVVSDSLVHIPYPSVKSLIFSHSLTFL